MESERRTSSPHYEEATKGLWWMPRRQMPTKDVGHCEKPRGAVNKRRSGDVRMGKPTGANLQYRILNQIGIRGEPGELKHLSTQRKRNDSQSSGERNGKSPNQCSELYWGCRASCMELQNLKLVEWCGKASQRG